MSKAATYTATAYTAAWRPHAAPDRDALIEAHLPQVKYIADRMAAKLPPSVDRDDLVGAGLLGLLDAVDKYDPTRGVLFKTYAEARVRGAMLDSLRHLDWAPRSVRRRSREIEAAYAEIEQQRGRPATEEEVAAVLGLPLPEFQAALAELNSLSITNLDDAREAGDGGSQQALDVADEAAPNPLTVCEASETRERLTAAIDLLPERERQVVALYYLEELTMKEIGAVLGVTESRVSQVHTQAVLRLRGALAGLGGAAPRKRRGA
jgi:RNA polymerase sigma factor for flagellar operon FliA